MLNLSDKELDRFSQEAAQEYEPGDVLPPRSWEKIEVHLDKGPGRFGSNPLRMIRRYPFYFAPVLLLLVGVTYYLLKPGKGAGSVSSGSPPVAEPGAAVRPKAVDRQGKSSSNNPAYSETSTP